MANRQMARATGQDNPTHAGVAMVIAAAVTGTRESPGLHRKEAVRHPKDRARHPIEAAHPLHRTGTRKDKC